MAQPTASLFGTALERAQEGTLGDTLRNIAGVNSASFGPAVGRPVIRGLGGARVKIMQDRVDSLDVSVSSPDHGAMVDPFIAQGVEVLKGPASLIYGTGAIGGVVNVVTNRIPSEVPEQLEGKVEVRGSDNADRRSASGRIDGGSGNFAFHFDGAY
ncbi:MAG: TonB-dependent receptor plug domain-containing protein, partial [Pseudomonadota bacterium]|nr:TonB-dependent receptor plug domain-containing protein [Pseudomonadota bacterium]